MSRHNHIQVSCQLTAADVESPSSLECVLSLGAPLLWPSHAILLDAKRRLTYLYGRTKETQTTEHILK